MKQAISKVTTAVNFTWWKALNQTQETQQIQRENGQKSKLGRGASVDSRRTRPAKAPGQGAGSFGGYKEIPDYSPHQGTPFKNENGRKKSPDWGRELGISRPSGEGILNSFSQIEWFPEVQKRWRAKRGINMYVDLKRHWLDKARDPACGAKNRNANNTIIWESKQLMISKILNCPGKGPKVLINLMLFSVFLPQFLGNCYEKRETVNDFKKS